MRTDTQAIRLSASPAEAFRFLADPATLPQWAVGFARAVRQDGTGWTVRTAHGEVRLRLETDAGTGIIDYHMTPAGGPDAVAYSRLLPVGDHTDYVFTQVQPDGMPDAVFDAQIQALAEELRILRSIFRARAACPA